MRKIILIFVFSLCYIVAQSQILKPASWGFSAKHIKGDVYEVHMTAAIQDGWKIYSQDTSPGGPDATSIKFSANPNILLGGKVKETGALKKKFEEVFDLDIYYYETKVDFAQVVKLKSGNGDRILKGKIIYMVCDKDQCINDEVGFSLVLK